MLDTKSKITDEPLQEMLSSVKYFSRLAFSVILSRIVEMGMLSWA